MMLQRPSKARSNTKSASGLPQALSGTGSSIPFISIRFLTKSRLETSASSKGRTSLYLSFIYNYIKNFFDREFNLDFKKDVRNYRTRYRSYMEKVPCGNSGRSCSPYEIMYGYVPDPSRPDNGRSCGPYQIMKGYWIDSGRPGSEYQSCVDDISCAEITVRGKSFQSKHFMYL